MVSVYKYIQSLEAGVGVPVGSVSSHTCRTKQHQLLLLGMRKAVAVYLSSRVCEINRAGELGWSSPQGLQFSQRVLYRLRS